MTELIMFIVTTSS